MPATTEIATPYGPAHLPTLRPGLTWRVDGPKSRHPAAAHAWLCILDTTGTAGDWTIERAVPRGAEPATDTAAVIEQIEQSAARLADVTRSAVDGAPRGPRPAFTPEHIKYLAPDEVFVFGSNEIGSHTSGAAKTAWAKFGAVRGQGTGPMGQSYGIDTMGTFETLARDVADFLAHATASPQRHFFVTKIGLGIAAWRLDDVAPLFACAPPNVTLPRSFAEWTRPDVEAEPSPLDQLLREEAHARRRHWVARSLLAVRADDLSTATGAVVRHLVADAALGATNLSWARSLECPTSAAGFCVYDVDADPTCDDCLFCHQPLERP